MQRVPAWLLLSSLLLLGTAAAAAKLDCSKGCEVNGPLVCGRDGNTYAGSCLAECQGVKLAKKKGPCKFSDRWLFGNSSGPVVGADIINKFKEEGFVYLGKGRALSTFAPSPPATESQADPSTEKIVRFVFATQDLYVASSSAFGQSDAVRAAAATATAAGTVAWPAYNPAIRPAVASGNATLDDVNGTDSTTDGRRLLQDDSAATASYPETTVGRFEYSSSTGGSQECYGTLVGPASVLTAAHCIHGGGPSSAFAAGFNFSAAAAGAFESVPAWYVTVYASWMARPKNARDAAANNVAVVTLAQPAGYQVGWVPVASSGDAITPAGASKELPGGPVWAQAADGSLVVRGIVTSGPVTSGRTVKLMTQQDEATALVSAASVTTRISLRGGRAGQFCSDDADTLVRCNRARVDAWERFTPEAVVSFNKFAYRGGRAGQYCADDADGRVRCNRPVRNAWEVFTVTTRQGASPGFVPQPGVNLIVTLQGGRANLFCSDDPEGLRCNRNVADTWEIFTLTFLQL